VSFVYKKIDISRYYLTCFPNAVELWRPNLLWQ